MYLDKKSKKGIESEICFILFLAPAGHSLTLTNLILYKLDIEENTR